VRHRIFVLRHAPSAHAECQLLDNTLSAMFALLYDYAARKCMILMGMSCWPSVQVLCFYDFTCKSNACATLRTVIL
jgi:hypothetical protein